jgi:hypothetical protein
MAIHQIAADQQLDGIPESYSYRPAYNWLTLSATQDTGTFVLGENIYMQNPKRPIGAAELVEHAFRYINCRLIDPEVALTTGITIISEDLQEFTFFPPHSGVFWITGIGISAIDDNIDPDTFQVGV